MTEQRIADELGIYHCLAFEPGHPLLVGLSGGRSSRHPSPDFYHLLTEPTKISISGRIYPNVSKADTVHHESIFGDNSNKGQSE